MNSQLTSVGWNISGAEFGDLQQSESHIHPGFEKQDAASSAGFAVLVGGAGCRGVSNNLRSARKRTG